MAEAKKDPRALVGKLRSRGLSDEDIESALTNLGYTRRQAREAIKASGAQDRAGSKPAGGKTRPPATQPDKADALTDPSTWSVGEAAPAPSTGGGSSWPQPTLKLPRQVGDLGGFAVGLFLYVLVINYLRYGPAGVTGWFKAKFVNKPIDTGAGATS